MSDVGGTAFSAEKMGMQKWLFLLSRRGRQGHNAGM
jgi:hypothetical protein